MWNSTRDKLGLKTTMASGPQASLSWKLPNGRSETTRIGCLLTPFRQEAQEDTTANSVKSRQEVKQNQKRDTPPV